MDIGKIPDFLKIYFTYIKKQPQCNYLPSRLWVEVTNHCNLKCRLCPNKDIPSKEKGYMDFNLFKRIADQIDKSINDIYLFHRGEPLLHPRLFEMVDYIKTRGATVRIHTNATLLNNENIKKILNSKLDFISFSFDGYLKETYEKNRVNSNYAKTLSGIISFLEQKKKLNQKTPYTVLQVMEYDEEYSLADFERQKKAFIKKFEGFPLDRFITRKPHNWGGLINTVKTTAKHYVSCTFLWYALVILYNGNIVPCPQDFNSNLVLGNIEDISIKDAFNNQKIQRLRTRIAHKDITEISPCSSCDRLWRETFMGLPTDYLKTFVKDNLGAS